MYMPVFHRGYLDFLVRNGWGNVDTELVLLDRLLLAQEFQELEHLSRDLRAVDFVHLNFSVLRAAEENEKLLGSCFGRLWKISDRKNLHDVLQEPAHFIAPDDDVTEVLSKHFPLFATNLTLDTNFLRWDKKTSLLHKEVNVEVAQPEVISEQLHSELQNQIKRSRDWWRQVGCVVFRDGKFLFGTYNQHFPYEGTQNILGDPRSNFGPGEHIECCTAGHAESLAVAHAAMEGIALKGTSVLVSDFPCPVCAKLLAATGIKELYFVQGYSNLDGLEVLQNANIIVKKIALP